MKKVVLLSGLFIILGAANSPAIQVTPTYQIFTQKPGEKTQGECTVTNNDDEKIIVTLSTKDWFVAKGNEPFKSHDWLTFETKKFVLMKGESQKVQFHVEAPKKAQGELVGMLSFSFSGEDVTSNVNKVLSLAIYSAVEGTLKLKGDLKAITIIPSTKTLDVAVMLTNQGNIHIRPTGWFEIRDEKGIQVANISLDPGRPVYPGKDGVYTGKAKEFELKPGRYKAHITLSDIDRQKEIVNTTRKFEMLENKTVELR